MSGRAGADSGKSGRLVTFARNPAKLNLRHERLAVLRGELADSSAIERAISGADAVISVLGPRPRKAKSKPAGTGCEVSAANARCQQRMLLSGLVGIWLFVNSSA
ncbi:MAG: NAD(P)H-binding protein [Betaproteobacteria bacterium]